MMLLELRSNVVPKIERPPALQLPARYDVPAHPLLRHAEGERRLLEGQRQTTTDPRHDVRQPPRGRSPRPLGRCANDRDERGKVIHAAFLKESSYRQPRVGYPVNVPDEKTPDPTLTVPRRMRALRQSEGLTLGQIAARTGLSLGHLSKLERGIQVPTVGTLSSLAAAFGVEVVDLVTDPDASPRHAAIAATATMTQKELRAIARPRLRIVEGDGQAPPRKKARRTSRVRPTKRGAHRRKPGEDAAG